MLRSIVYTITQRKKMLLGMLIIVSVFAVYNSQTVQNFGNLYSIAASR